MPAADGHAALIHIYDTVINPGRWRRALDAVSGVLEARAIALLIRRPDPDARDLQMVNSTYLKLKNSPWGVYYGLRLSQLQNPDWDFLSRQPAHHPVPDTEIGPSAAELDRRADYAFLRKRLGIGRRLGVRLNEDRMWFDAMSIAFDANVDRVPRTALEQTRFLLPHLTKAVEIGRTFAQLKARYAAALEVLDRVRVGLAIALPSGDIMVRNAEARRILELKDGLCFAANGRLCCGNAEQTAELAAAIRRAADTARGRDTAVECLMAVQRRSAAPAFLVEVVPLRDSETALDGPLEGALITLIDPEQVPYPRLDRFMALYGLTPAEAEVCALLVQGLPLADIAEARGTSPVTAKNQIAAVLGKTGVSRQSDLIRRVIRVMPPVQ